MRKFIFICLLLPVMQLQAQQIVTLKGSLLHFSNEVNIEDMSELQYLQPASDDRMIIPDSTNKFQISFRLQSPNYFRLGRNILYLSPGDDLNLLIDYNDPRKADFTGKGQEANNYLRETPFPKGGSYLEAGSKAQPTALQTIQMILQAGIYRKKQLDSIKNISKTFRDLETGRIRADIINSLIDGKISFYRPRAIQKDSVKMKEYADEYALLIKPLVDSLSKGFIDPELLKLVVYRDHVAEFSTQAGSSERLQPIKDWINASALADSMRKLSDKEDLKKLLPKVAVIKTLVYRNALTRMLHGLLQFGKGDRAIDFSATDMNGHTIKLSSLKGKLIYIDLWATWCGPCIEEMPFFEALKEKFRDNDNIVFVSLSIDDNTALWKDNVQKRKTSGIQWMINRNKLAAYNIIGIPRSLLINKDFGIIDLQAPLPSSKKLPGLLTGLLN